MPTAWNYGGSRHWRLDVVAPNTSLRLFDPEPDIELLSVTRIGDAGRQGLFRWGLPEPTGGPRFTWRCRWTPPAKGLPDYTVSLVIASRIEARRESHRRREGGAPPPPWSRRPPGTSRDADGGRRHQLERGGAGGQHLERAVDPPLGVCGSAAACCCRRGFPASGTTGWARRRAEAAPADRPRLEHLERLQLSLRREEGVVVVPPARYGVEVEWVRLEFGDRDSEAR